MLAPHEEADILEQLKKLDKIIPREKEDRAKGKSIPLHPVDRDVVDEKEALRAQLKA